MPRRQLLAFQIGCWSAFLTAALHLFGHVQGPQPPVNAAQEALLAAMTTVTVELPDGAQRTMMDFMNGFSLSFSLFLALWGGLGLVILKRGRDDAALMYAAARASAGAAVVLLALSLNYWFLIPSMCIALIAISFAVASVKAP